MAPYYTATSTTATSTFTNLAATQYTTLATTTITGTLTVNGNTNITDNGQLTVGDKIIAPGEILLGTTTPLAKLTIQSTDPALSAQVIRATAAQSAPLLSVLSDTDNLLFRIAPDGSLTTAIPSGLVLSQGGLLSATSTLSAAYVEDAFIRNTGDTASGSYNFANNTLVVDHATGRVGIGTTSPAAKLQINTGVAGTTGLLIQDAPSQTAPLTTWLRSDNVVLAKMLRTGLQIGTDALHVLLSGNNGGLIISNGATATARVAPYQNDIYLQNTFSSGKILFTGNLGGDLTGDIILKTAGNVGIGDTTPDGKLDVESTGAVTAANYGLHLSNLTTNATTDGINKYAAYLTSTGSFTGGAGAATNNYGLYVDTISGADNNYAAYFGGNVGIGTNAPTQRLNISGGNMRINTAGGTDPKGLIIAGFNSAGNQYGLFFGVDSATLEKGLIVDRDTGRLSIINHTGSTRTERLTILESGNVGIRTTEPGAQLQINTSAADKIGQIIRAAASQSANLTEWHNSSGQRVAAINAVGNRLSFFHTGGSEQGYITTNGTWGFAIGIEGVDRWTLNNAGDITQNGKNYHIGSIDGLRLGVRSGFAGAGPHVISTLGEGAAFPFTRYGNLVLSPGRNAGASPYGNNIVFVTGATGQNMSVIDVNGNVSIATTSAPFKLTIAGHVGPASDATYTLGSASLAWECVYASGDTLGTCASDERLKQHITDLTFDNPLTALTNLKPRSFSFTDAPDNTYHGLIAQEVQQAGLDALVTTGSNGFLAVKYGDVQWLILEAVKELWAYVQERFAGQEEKNAAYEAELSALRAEVEALKAAAPPSSAIPPEPPPPPQPEPPAEPSELGEDEEAENEYTAPDAEDEENGEGGAGEAAAGE